MYLENLKYQTEYDMRKPKEIIVNEKVKNDPATLFFISQCPGISVKYVKSGVPGKIVEASDILKQQYDALPEDQRDAIRDEIAMFAHDFQSENGLHIPHDYLVATGFK